jgi:outer membrane protein
METKSSDAGRAWICLAVSFLFAANCFAEDFSLREALHMARENDPTYLAARAKLDAAQARHSQSTSYLLPQINLKGTANRYDRRYERTEPLVGDSITRQRYDGYNAQLTMSQPLYRRANFVGITQANASLRQAEEEALAADQDLLLRLAQAWLDGVSTEDAQAHAESRSVAARRQWDQLEKASQIQLASAPALADARAKSTQAAAERIAAASEREAKLSKLEEIVGPLPGGIFPTLSSSYAPPAPTMRTLDEWLEIVDADNPSVNAARAALFAANSEVDRQRAGHEPTIDLVGNYSYNRQGEGDFPGQSPYKILQYSVGIELNIPLFQGGLQSAKVREALALRSQAEQELHGAMRSARSMTRSAWFAWQAGNARQLAGNESMHAAALALHAARVGVTQEVKFDLDVLEAREQLLDAWTKTQQARYEAVLECLRLKAASGVLSDDDLLDLDNHQVPRTAELQMIVEVRN